MPVHMPVCLLTPQAEDVQALCRNNPGESAANTPHYTLKGYVLVFREIGSDLLQMFARSNETIAVKSRILTQKRNRELVLEEDVMRIVGVALHGFADETPSC